ncbi:hypothetical protein ACOMHN_035893 [Nucella lapillus]
MPAALCDVGVIVLPGEDRDCQEREKKGTATSFPRDDQHKKVTTASSTPLHPTSATTVRAISSPLNIPSRVVMRQSLSSSPRARKAPRAVNIDTSMDPNLEKDDKYEIKSGKLLLLHKMGQRSSWFPVHVRVYRNAFEHFAVVSKDQAISANSTYVNLRAATCSSPENTEKHFNVVQNNYEGTVISFDAGDKESVKDWVEAFTCATPPGSPTQGGMSPTLSPAIPRSPVMPTLPELDEEE